MDTFPVNNFWAWHVKESKEEAHKEARIWLAVRGTIYDKYIRDVVSDEEAKVVAENISSFINAYHTKSDVIEGVSDEILTKIIDHGTSASTIADIDREVDVSTFSLPHCCRPQLLTLPYRRGWLEAAPP